MIDSSGLKKLAVFVTALPMREMQCSLCRKRKKKKKIEVAHKSRTHDFPNTERMPSMPKYKKVSRRATPFTRLALTGDLHAARTCNVQSLPYGNDDSKLLHFKPGSEMQEDTTFTMLQAWDKDDI